MYGGIQNIFKNTFLWLTICSIINAQDYRLEDEQIELDGKLIEQYWNNALMFSLFRQITPNIGTTAQSETEAYLLYDNNSIYIGMVSFQADSLVLFSSILERDAELERDDYVGVIIDTYNDKTNALIFQTNLLNNRYDVEATNNARDFNPNWDTFWDARSVKTSFGWSTEFKIPFSILRFEEKEKIKMGFRFIRNVKADNELSVSPLDKWDIENPSYNLTSTYLVEFENISSRSTIYLTPYVKSKITNSKLLKKSSGTFQFGDFTFEKNNFVNGNFSDLLLSNIGVDLKYKINNTNTIDVTLNTDFAQVEEDDLVINLTRYSIFFPEKRKFFLEKNNFFNSGSDGHNIFHSRKVGIENGRNIPIIGGARFYGTGGNFSYGLMNIQTHKADSLSSSGQNFSVARFKNKFGSDDSYLGAIFTNKFEVQTDKFNRVAGIDGSLRISDKMVIDYFASTSFSDNRENFRNKSYGVLFDRSNPDGYYAYYFLREYQQNFSPGMGYVNKPNNIGIITENGYAIPLRKDNIFSFLEIGVITMREWVSSTKNPLFFRFNPYVLIDFPGGSELDLIGPLYKTDIIYSDWQFADDVIISPKKYEMISYIIEYDYTNSRDLEISLAAELGDFYDGSQKSIEYEINYIFSSNFTANFGGQYTLLNFPQTGGPDRELTRTFYQLRLIYNFNSELNLRTSVQYDNISNTIRSTLRFRYNPSEGTDLFFVVSNDYMREETAGMLRNQYIDEFSCAIKLSKTFVL